MTRWPTQFHEPILCNFALSIASLLRGFLFVKWRLFSTSSKLPLASHGLDVSMTPGSQTMHASYTESTYKYFPTSSTIRQPGHSRWQTIRLPITAVHTLIIAY